MNTTTTRSGTLLYAQSGGVTAVINATAGAVIASAREQGLRVLAARNGILGVLQEELVDTGSLSTTAVDALQHTPGSAFGSCRYRLGDIDTDRAQYQRLLEVLREHDVRWLLYNGGNDSADTALKLAQFSRESEYRLTVIGVPKTIDNDLEVTDCSPGFGSAAKYTAVAMLEASLDVASMHSTSTRVFILETMGRHAGWMTAAAALAADRGGAAIAPLLLFPERSFDPAVFLQRVTERVAEHGFCTVAASEGIRGADGKFYSAADQHDAFGHAQLGGVAPRLAALVRQELDLKVHWAVPDYLQRSARHVVSAVDLEHAIAVGRAGVAYALEGRNGSMPVIVREPGPEYRWSIAPAALVDIANHEKKLPDNFISADGMGITAAARAYLSPLIRGEAPPPYARDGLPHYPAVDLTLVEQKLPAWQPPA